MNTQVPLLKTPCCAANITVVLEQSASAEIDENGSFKEFSDFTEKQVYHDYYQCNKCGEEIVLEWDNDKKKYVLNARA